MTMMRVDPDAHAMLTKIKKEMKASGRNGTTYSDAIRYMVETRAELLKKLYLVG